MTFDLYTTLYIIAIIAEAMTAALLAGRRNMDWIGVFFLGCVTSLGGGSVRDVLLNHYPLSWINHPYYPLLTGFSALATIAIAPHMHKFERLFLILDAIGLVVFTVIGCRIALMLHLPFVSVLLSGMITGCAGGIMRDVLCNDIPLVFRSELYATASIASGLVYLLCRHLTANDDTCLIISMIVGLSFRLLSIRFQWRMPSFSYSRNHHH
ncbi:trimeric intracellular cation channel family protein [Saccharibacter floricola]|uniref:trimeric intracellular cation channel family protein n=1 Tax=Saccharibacter floricola TaxID=231053 RepID=UPI0003755832|nr:trimeric intracellular cation channel family protein [Saccharibacter floricola]